MFQKLKNIFGPTGSVLKNKLNSWPTSKLGSPASDYIHCPQLESSGPTNTARKKEIFSHYLSLLSPLLHKQFSLSICSYFYLVTKTKIFPWSYLLGWNYLCLWAFWNYFIITFDLIFFKISILMEQSTDFKSSE